jgi:hypothetical protein
MRTMTETSTKPVVPVVGYLKQWMFDPNHQYHPLLTRAAGAMSATAGGDSPANSRASARRHPA